jgi:CBS domain-containing protein
VAPKLVRDLMTVGVPTCKPDSLVGDIARFLIKHDVEAMCVLDEEGHAIGIIGAQELVRAYTRDGVRSLTAEQVMTEGVPELQAELPLAVAGEMMRDQNTRIAYIMHNAAGISYPAAYVSYKHLIRHLAAESDEELSDLGTAAARKSPMAQFMERRDEARRRNLDQKDGI